MATTKDISIGENKWIKWVELDQISDETVLDVDDLFSPTLDFWNSLEIHCVAECCGIDAFAFWEEDVRRAISSLDRIHLSANLKSVKLELEQSDKLVVSASKLNSYLDKSMFIQLVDHILSIIEQ